MEKYKNEDYLKKEIMEQSRHLFIYGYNNDHRSVFLKDLESEYPIKINSDKPVALYFDSFGFLKVDASFKDKDSCLIDTLSSEFLSFTIAAKILEKSMELDRTILNNRLSKLINLINRSKNVGYVEIKTVEQLLKEMKISRDFYYENYINYINGLIEIIPIDKVLVPFLQLDFFVSFYKNAMNMDSYFGIIFDKKAPLAISSTRAINNLIGGRINDNMSIKVAIEADDWETYRDVNGQFVEAIHDYGTVELDDSFNNHMKTLKKDF